MGNEEIDNDYKPEESSSSKKKWLLYSAVSFLGIGLAGFAIFIFMEIPFDLKKRIFAEIPYVLTTFIGGIISTIVANQWSVTTNILHVFKQLIHIQKYDLPGLISTLVVFSEKGRREGLLAIESDCAEIPDEFLGLGLQLAIDGTDPELVHSILEIKMRNISRRHAVNRKWLENLGLYTLRFGVLATMIHIIATFQNYKIMGGEAVFEETAFSLIYSGIGVVTAYLFCFPFADKLLSKTNDEIMEMEMKTIGVLAIQSGDNPTILNKKLWSFLSRYERNLFHQSQ